MSDFSHTELLPLGPDANTYRKLDVEGVSTLEAAGHTFLQVEPQVLTALDAEAMHDIAHYLRPIDLNRPMDEIRRELSRYPVKTRLSLTGTVVVARDIAHAKIAELLESGGQMPPYLCDHPVYYAGPGQDPRGLRLGQLRPHHRRAHGLLRGHVPGRRRVARHVGQGQPLAAGHRRMPGARRLLPRFHRRLGGPPGPGLHPQARKVLEYPELGMEAVWRIEVENFPAFVVVDDKGNDFFEQVTTPVALDAEP